MTEQVARQLKNILSRLDLLEAMAHILYAKASYTPAYSGATTAGVTTHSAQSGYYIRLGNLMLVWGQVVWTAATGTGNAQVSLPSLPAVISTLGNVRCSTVTFAAGAPEILTSGVFFQLRSPTTNAATTPVAVEAAGDIIFGLAYTL